MDITLDTDWGAKGAQLTGAQVQAFIKKQFRELIANDENLQTGVDDLTKRLTKQESQTDAITDGCFVAFHRKSNGWPSAVPYWMWPEIEATGEVADGVLVLVDGKSPILVAPTEQELLWSKNDYDVDVRVGKKFEKAYVDFTGQTRTAALMACSDNLYGTDASTLNQYAAAWCFNYDRSYKYHDTESDKNTTVGVLKNRWWLPSIAELVVIWKYKYAINLCLSVITGATLISDAWYWSSTEATASIAWRLKMDNGSIQGGNKTSDSHKTRAVTSFYDMFISNGRSELPDLMLFSDSRFKRYGNCAVYVANEDSKPIAILPPITEDNIKSAIINYRYTHDQIVQITNDYQISQRETFTDEVLKFKYTLEYNRMIEYLTDAITVAHGALPGSQL